MDVFLIIAQDPTLLFQYFITARGLHGRFIFNISCYLKECPQKLEGPLTYIALVAIDFYTD